MNRWFSYIMFLLMCLFVYPFNCLAECDYQRIAELNKIAGNVSLSYTYEIDEKGIPVFKIYVSNITGDIYVRGNYAQVYEGDAEIPGLINGSSNTFEIFSKDSNCFGEKLAEKYVNLPSFNHFSSDQACLDHPNFKYCKTWGYLDVSYDKFNSEYQKYLSDSSAPALDNGVFDGVLGFFKDRIVLVVLALVLMIIGLIIFVIRRRIYAKN